MDVFVRILLGLLMVSSTHGRRVTFSCNNARKAYQEKGYLDSEVPLESVPGDHLEICSLPSTCCTKQMEQNLAEQTKKDFQLLMEEKTRFLFTLFSSKANKFDEFFKELVKNSERDLDIMFKKTYGILYEQNSKVFTDLFTDLKKYYSGGAIDLNQAMDSFFMELLKRMFQLLNPKYSFNRSYLDCVTYYMDDLKPFGSVPEKLTPQLRRSFVAARTFVQGLNVGKNVITALTASKMTTSCRNAITNMTHCSMCRGLRDVKPCSGLCLNVYKGCLANLAEIDSDWEAYLNAMLELVEKMEGPYSIETAIDPIDVKISDAIMNLQEGSSEFSKKIFSGCGKPSGTAMKRRSADDSDFFLDSENGESRTKREEAAGDSKLFPLHKLADNPDMRPTTAAGTSLERLTGEFRNNVKNTKGYWSRLPSTFCADEKVAADAEVEDDCWNGVDRKRYSSPVVGDGLIAQLSNPAVEVDTRQVTAVVREQAAELREIVTQLRKAINGENVQVEGRVPDEETSTSGPDISGSGSGDESGDGNEIPTDVVTTEGNTGNEIDGVFGDDDTINFEAEAGKSRNSASRNALSAVSIFSISLFVYLLVK